MSRVRPTRKQEFSSEELEEAVAKRIGQYTSFQHAPERNVFDSILSEKVTVNMECVCVFPICTGSFIADDDQSLLFVSDVAAYLQAGISWCRRTKMKPITRIVKEK